jgi:hypothetical protein
VDSPRLYLSQHEVDALHKRFLETRKGLLLGEGYWERWLADYVVVIEPIEWDGPNYGRYYRTIDWIQDRIVRPIKWNRWRKRRKMLC